MSEAFPGQPSPNEQPEQEEPSYAILSLRRIRGVAEAASDQANPFASLRNKQARALESNDALGVSDVLWIQDQLNNKPHDLPTDQAMTEVVTEIDRLIEEEELNILGDEIIREHEGF